MSSLSVPRGNVLIRFENGKGLKDKIKFDSGAEIYVHSDERPEIWANTIGECIASGVEGVSVGDTVGCSYQAVFNYDHDRYGNKIWMNCYRDDEGSMIFKVSEDLIMFKRDLEGVDHAYGNWVLIREARHPEDGLKTGLKRGIGLHESGLPLPKGVEIYFEERFRGVELYDRKYIVMHQDRILAHA